MVVQRTQQSTTAGVVGNKLGDTTREGIGREEPLIQKGIYV